MSLDVNKILLDTLSNLLGFVFSKNGLLICLIFVLALTLKFFLTRDLKRFDSWYLFKKNPTLPDVVKNMSGSEFEIWVKGLFQKAGANAEVIGGVGDHGIDLVVKHEGKKIAVQCKKYYPGYFKGKYHSGNIGEPVVRNLYGSQHGAGYDSSILITTGGFTLAALNWVKHKPDITLIGKNELTKLISNPEDIIKYL